MKGFKKYMTTVEKIKLWQGNNLRKGELDYFISCLLIELSLYDKDINKVVLK